MEKTKEITPIQYAKYYGCNPTYIQRLLRAEQYDKLPFVISVKRYSRFWTLEVPDTLTESDFKEVIIS